MSYKDVVEGGVGDLKYVSSIAEGRALGENWFEETNSLPRLCSPRCWMATHDPVKCELWTGLVGPCHLIIVGPSGSRTTVQFIPYFKKVSVL